jgi:Domain of unknown function (DUF4145)
VNCFAISSAESDSDRHIIPNIMQLRVKGGLTSKPGGYVSIRCPACKQIGTFETIGSDLTFQSDNASWPIVGHRVCPNPSCKAHLFVVINNNALFGSYPPERIDFDATAVPDSIIQSLEEAITCHANHCYVAAAIMIRKTLELLCFDQGVTGANLKERIKLLGTKAVLPPDLFSGLDDLRLLGNDAAHIESEAYEKISQEELEVGIEFTKEVLKATYQYTSLLKRLRGLKKSSGG